MKQDQLQSEVQRHQNYDYLNTRDIEGAQPKQSIRCLEGVENKEEIQKDKKSFTRDYNSSLINSSQIINAKTREIQQFSKKLNDQNENIRPHSAKNFKVLYQGNNSNLQTRDIKGAYCIKKQGIQQYHNESQQMQQCIRSPKLIEQRISKPNFNSSEQVKSSIVYSPKQSMPKSSNLIHTDSKNIQSLFQQAQIQPTFQPKKTYSQNHEKI